MTWIDGARAAPRRDAVTHLTRNTVVFFILNLATAGFSFLVSVLIGRNLGAVALGQYSLALAWSLTLAQFADLGMNTLLTRELAREPDLTPRYVSAALYAKTVLALGLALLLLLLAPMLTRQAEAVIALQLSATLVLFNAWYSTFITVLRAFGRAPPILALNAGGLLVQTGLTFFLIAQGWQVNAILLTAVVLQLAQCVIAGAWYRTEFPLQFRQVSWERAFVLQMLARAFPFAVAGIIGAAELRANLFLLGWLENERAVGWYSAASRVTDGLRFAPNAFFGALLPALAALSTREHANAARRMFQRAGFGLCAFALCIASSLTVTAPWIVDWTYGAQFEPARAALVLLGWGLLPALFLGLLTLFLYAQHQEGAVNRVLALGLGLHVAFAVPFILNWSTAGAAAAAGLSDVVVCSLLFKHAMPFLKNR